MVQASSFIPSRITLGTTMSYKVFVSYSTRDLETVNRVQALFKDASIDVFIAEYSVKPGESLSSRIPEAIRECDLFLLLWTSTSIASEWVQQEVGAARGLGKAVLPLLLEPDVKMPAFLADVKYLVAHQNVEQALVTLRQEVFAKAASKQQQEGLVWLGLTLTVLFLLTKK